MCKHIILPPKQEMKMSVKLSLKIPDPTPCVEKNEVILRHYSGWTLCRRPKDSAELRGGRENCHYES